MCRNANKKIQQWTPNCILLSTISMQVQNSIHPQNIFLFTSTYNEVTALWNLIIYLRNTIILSINKYLICCYCFITVVLMVETIFKACSLDKYIVLCCSQCPLILVNDLQNFLQHDNHKLWCHNWHFKVCIGFKV